MMFPLLQGNAQLFMATVLIVFLAAAEGFIVAVQPHRRSCSLAAALSEADKDRLLMDKVGMTAFIAAEMRHFVHTTMVGFDDASQVYERKWQLTDEDLLQTELGEETNNGTIVVTNEDYLQACQQFEANGTLAVELIVKTTRTAFQEGYEQQGLLSALGSAILFFRNYYRTPTLLAACERIGLSDYQVAHHITDMYHHRTFRGAYTKTLMPSGEGEIAARIAVGLQAAEGRSSSSMEDADEQEEEEDECLCWSPTTPGVCLNWKSEDEAWRKTRFERIQMEGTRDPRRGGSGTTR